ncbi:cupin-like domain-containing protein [Oleiagrimonas sp. C23AA]|uniref:cupin-like domain-containing protein n=1 Tax=Oleiagrimonas sp. C23AA TaxID=2719047 RepID=UPI001F0D94DC|nr:cupin-like domain-containing protein [Oleiagrimonas sp. C23AA]
MPHAMEERAASAAPVDLQTLCARQQPVVLRGLVADWPAVAWARESNLAFARQMSAFDAGTPVDTLLLPEEAEGRVGYNEAFDDFNYDHHRVSVTRVLKRLLVMARDGDGRGLAMQSAAMKRCMPGFEQTHAMALLPGSVHPRLWLGNRVTTPAHFDEQHNIACVVCGRRRFTLFAPEQVGNLYIGPLDFAPTGAAISLARLDRPDDPRFPRLRQALDSALQAELEPGDAIYIPPLWWHHVASLTAFNGLVNYWWHAGREDAGVPDTAMGGLLHAILTFRSLSTPERRAWRALLDHYVFDESADPVSHIPEARRGILGDLTPEQVARVRETIKRYL